MGGCLQRPSYLLSGYIAGIDNVEMVIFRKRVAGLSEPALTAFVTRAKRAIRLGGAVAILVTSSRELQQLNRRFRGKNKPTDVLSFPAFHQDGFAGDIAISAEIAAQNARLLRHTPAEEVKVLTLHGLLHLAGYDHEQDQGEMARKEQRLRTQLGLPRALIERQTRRPPNDGIRQRRLRKAL